MIVSDAPEFDESFDSSTFPRKADVRDFVTALTHQDVTPREKLTLFVVADFYNQNKGYAWPSISKLATLALCSPRQARRVLRELEAKGIIIAYPRIVSGRQTSNAYAFVAFLPDDDRDAALDRAAEIRAELAAAKERDFERRVREDVIPSPLHAETWADTIPSGGDDTIPSGGDDMYVRGRRTPYRPGGDDTATSAKPVWNRELEPGTRTFRANTHADRRKTIGRVDDLESEDEWEPGDDFEYDRYPSSQHVYRPAIVPRAGS